LSIATKQNSDEVIALEYAYTNTQAHFNRIRDQIRSSKEIDFQDLVR
jgi:hypothetical protein